MKNYFASLTRVSSNKKTGPIPVSTTTRDTCPDACAFKAKGCYASYGPTALHWRKVTSGERGKLWADFCADIKALPRDQLFRHNQAGDLPGDGIAIDLPALEHLVKAAKGKRGFTYTHYEADKFDNAQAIKWANDSGFTINLSGNTIAHADTLAALKIGPVVVVLPKDAPNVSYTPNGIKVVACPAEKSDKINCANCGLCQLSERPYIIGFRAHGTAAKTVDLIAKG
jgi:hypothetical protein